jgi:AcrR family transcriptional regulator
MTELVMKCQSRGVARRQAMIEAARTLFLEKGFEQTSVSDIVERSKGSRSTLYKQFGNKEGLLRAMVEGLTTRLWVEINWHEALPEALEEFLIGLGVRFATITLSAESLAVYRIVVAEGHRVPEIARLFFESGPRVFQERLTEVFQKGQADGRFRPGPPELMARAFGGSVLGDLHIRRVLGLLPHLSDEHITNFVRSMIQPFLYGVSSSPKKEK